ncbi:MAG: TetR/AcrR family transcriptional regulator [Acetobacteraceae bacterium]|nr:TetR family transcriptional regulator [Pseudomonadota bacterium]
MPAREPAARKPDPDRTRRDILEVARAEFVEHGLAGARVDAIAERTATTKRMIYYYFGSKEGLYSAVLQQAYAGIRTAEADLALDDLDPETAMRRLIDLTFDYHDEHPDFVRLVSIENIHQGAYLRRLGTIGEVNAGIIHTLSRIVARGVEAGLFHRSADPVDLHMLISAPCFYRVSNQHTFGAIFGRDLQAPEVRQAHRRLVADMVLAWLRGGAADER